MNARYRWALLLGCLITFVAGWTTLAGNTYITDISPDVDVTEPDCYSFVITVDQGSGSSATLTLRVYDVDEEAGEIDTVSINGHEVGHLSGTNETWSTTSFDVSSWITYGGDNTVQVCIDPGGGEDTTWVATIDWGQILVDGGSAADADITSVNASGTWNAIQVATGISAANTDTYRLEINLLDSTGNNKDIAVDTFGLSGGSSTTRYNTVSLPSEPTETETFTIEANLFNDTTGVQQAIKTTTWTYVSNHPPVADDQSVTTNEDTARSIVLTASDIEDGTPGFTSHTDPAHGTLLGTMPNLTYSPDSDYCGDDSFDFTVTDSGGLTDTGTLSITITCVNDSPEAIDDSASVIEGSSVIVDVLANDTDVDGDALHVTSVSDPAKGTATIMANDSVKYVPDYAACGSDTFSYTIEDGNGGSASASVSVTIQNVPPTAHDDTAETQEEESVLIDVLTNDSDPGSDLTIVAVGAPRHGTASAVGNNVRYAPVPRFEGEDRFSYTISDACGAQATAWVDVDVLHTNHPPEANAGLMYRGVVGEPLTLDASFSSDPDIGDILQYRWDIDGDGEFDTDWSTDAHYTAVYSASFFGQITLEVRDLYQGRPTGEVSQATALVRVVSVQSLQVYVFEDLDGNGVMDDGEPGLPGIDVTVAGKAMTTQLDGGISVELNPGSWSVSIDPASILRLESRSYAVGKTEATVDLEPGAIESVAFAVVKTSTKVKGFVYADIDGNEEYDEDVDQLLQGLRVILDDDRETLTDDSGRFFFLSVSFGEHTLWIGENDKDKDKKDVLSLTVPITLERGKSVEFAVLWPWKQVGPEKGFLQVEVEKSGGK